MLQKTLLSLVVSLLVCGCATLENKSDPLVGVWDYEIFNLPRGEPVGFFTVAKIDDRYAIVLTSPKAQMKVEDVSIEGERIASGYFKSEGYTIDLRGTFDGDTFEGNINADGNVFQMMATKRE